MGSITKIMTRLSLVLLVAGDVARAAPNPDDIWSYQINTATAGRWAVLPDRPKPEIVATQGAQFAQALRVQGRHGANPWDIQVSSPAGAAIPHGHLVLLLLYARAEKPAEGGSVLPIKLQLAADPYTALLQADRRIDGTWKQYCAYAVAAQDFPAATNVTIFLGGAEQVVDFGPAFVFDLGTGFDQTRLPHCDQ